jgi:hypothetical protein
MNLPLTSRGSPHRESPKGSPPRESVLRSSSVTNLGKISGTSSGERSLGERLRLYVISSGKCRGGSPWGWSRGQCEVRRHVPLHSDRVNRDLYRRPRGWATCAGAKNKAQWASSHPGSNSGFKSGFSYPK